METDSETTIDATEAKERDGVGLAKASGSTRWLITITYGREQTPTTTFCEEHPADWLAKYGYDDLTKITHHLLFAMPITKEQAEALEGAGYG